MGWYEISVDSAAMAKHVGGVALNGKTFVGHGDTTNYDDCDFENGPSLD